MINVAHCGYKNTHKVGRNAHAIVWASQVKPITHTAHTRARTFMETAEQGRS